MIARHTPLHTQFESRVPAVAENCPTRRILDNSRTPAAEQSGRANLPISEFFPRTKTMAKAIKPSKSGPSEVEAYLASIPEPARATLLTVRETIRSVAPGATEEISYGVPAFRSPEPKAGHLAGYAAGRKFCSYYPMSGSVLTTLKDAIKAYPTTKGALQFPLDQPLPVALIKKLIQTRLKEIEAGKL